MYVIYVVLRGEGMLIPSAYPTMDIKWGLTDSQWLVPYTYNQKEENFQ
jgi:hypothetical protein